MFIFHAFYRNCYHEEDQSKEYCILILKCFSHHQYCVHQARGKRVVVFHSLILQNISSPITIFTLHTVHITQYLFVSHNHSKICYVVYLDFRIPF